MNGSSSQALHSKGGLGFGTYPGQTLTDLAQLGGGHAFAGEETVKHPRSSDGGHELTVDPSRRPRLGHGYQGLPETLSLGYESVVWHRGSTQEGTVGDHVEAGSIYGSYSGRHRIAFVATTPRSRKGAFMEAMPSASRNLFRAALAIFIVTVVIGILNGTDLWDPPRNTLLTHVHAGTLGWITLSVFGGAIWMIGADVKTTRPMAMYAMLAVGAYVLAFWSVDLTDTVSIQRPIGGILAFIAMVWVFVWAVRSMRGRSYNVAQFGMVLALAFLVFGAVLGVLLGLQLADVEVVAAENADRLGASHPGAMVAGYVVLAGLALIEWLIQDRVPTISESKIGAVQMVLLLLAGVVLVVGFLADSEELLQVGVPLQVIGALILLGRHGRRLAPAGWKGRAANRFVRVAVLGLLAVVVLIAVLITQIVGGKDFEEVVHIALAFDHVNFLLVSTSLIFAMMSLGSKVTEATNNLVFSGLTVGAAGFVVGLLLQENVMKRIFTPILGLALLYGIYTYLTAAPAEVREGVSV